MKGKAGHSTDGWKHLFLPLLVLALLFCCSTQLPAQSLISGEVVGTVTDPSGAVVPKAAVTLKSNETGQSQTVTTNGNGFYRFPLQKPGQYTVTATAPSFQATGKTVNVAVGQETTTNIQLAMAGGTQTVTVTGEAPVIQTENGNLATTFTETQISLVPNPGNDLSYIAQTAPGATMNTQAGYGNFETYGLPGTSNLFTVNGEYEIDPFLNLNNSGATNLQLGANDIKETTLVNNGYSGQYGGMAGSNVNYVTKSGTNSFHGNAIYYWNGRIMNANDYLNKASQFENGRPNARPFDNVNQWAASVGGPIKKDKLFFFVDTEGNRILLPRVRPVVKIPTPEFEAATLANISATNPSEVSLYQNMFNLYNNAPGAKFASPVANSCGSLSFSFACAQEFSSVVKNLTHEWMLMGRVDMNISSKDTAFIHFRTDHGVQATYTDPISSIFNAQSNQPQYEGQFNWNHTFNSQVANQFVLAGSWYSAIFAPANLNNTLAAMPFMLSFTGGTTGTLYPLGNDLNVWPQGRNNTQYQGSDDISIIKGNHTLKFGVNFIRFDVTDADLGVGTTGSTLFSETLSDFFAGNATAFQQTNVQRTEARINMYNLGFYGQDEWKVRPGLVLTLTLRADRNSNISCPSNCFARLAAPFESISHDTTVPYNQAIQSGLKQALPGIDAIQFEPRVGFAWSPLGTGHSTVLRGGFGLFVDRFPAFAVDSFLANPPISTTFTAAGVPLAGASGVVAGASSAFIAGLQNGGSLASITGCPPGPNQAMCVSSFTFPSGAPFIAPGVTGSVGTVHYPRYEEWNLELQQGIGQKMAASINYVGNHGIHEPYLNTSLNAFCDATCVTGLSGLGTAVSTGFAGLPAAAPDPRFGFAQQLETNAVSNYNGVTFSLQRKFSALTVQASYTYSHALDEVSNGGFLPFNFQTNTSLVTLQDPNNLRGNYGNADYDHRHYGSLSWVYNSPDKFGPAGLLGGWVLSGTVFGRSGFPFSVIDSGATGILSTENYGGALAGVGQSFVFANQTGPTSASCGRTAVDPNAPCPNPAAFTDPVNGFANQRRNQFFGPQFFDMDFSVLKNFRIHERVTLGVGAQFFNILNHPNFDQPVDDFSAGTGKGGLGNITNTVSVPTSILGSFLGGDASPRMIQLTARFTF